MKIQCQLEGPKMDTDIGVAFTKPYLLGDHNHTIRRHCLAKLWLLWLSNGYYYLLLFFRLFYQHFWVHLQWFFALFHISDEKWLLSQLKQKVSKNGTFWSQTLFLKNFPIGARSTMCPHDGLYLHDKRGQQVQNFLTFPNS